MYKKKLIEVALPLDAINKASAREKSIRHGHPSTLHLWWARRPLAAARAVIFAQMVDDPSEHPDLFPTEKAQEKERQRLFRIIEDLVQWENTTNEEVLERARAEIWQSWRSTCAENTDHPRASELFNRNKLPAFHDPFAGGGALPLEAQRFGLDSYASDLNPVAVLINKAMIEIPPKFASQSPVNPESRLERTVVERKWRCAQGLAEDVRYYGQWMRDEAEKRIGHLYPKVEVVAEMTRERPDLKKYVGMKLTVIAWIWARTVKSPNPAFAQVDVPLASSFVLSTKKGKEAYIDPIVENGSYRFTVKMGKSKDTEAVKRGTKASGSGSSFLCLISGTPIPFEYIRNEGKSGRIGMRLMAVVTEGDRTRVFFPPTLKMEKIALSAIPENAPETELPPKALGFRVQEYGMTKWKDLFTNRQLVAITTLSDLVSEARERIQSDSIDAGLADDQKHLRDDGRGATAYSEAVGLYLGFLINQVANHSSSFCGWNTANTQMRSVFARQAIPMVWDFAESNPLSNSSGSFNNLFERQIKGFGALGCGMHGKASQADAISQSLSSDKLVSTDPPYYDNIGYADLSDFFYVWLRCSQRSTFPNLLSTVTVPKAEELIATPYRHKNKESAENFFLDGMTKALNQLSKLVNPLFPITIYYAFKQSEILGDSNIKSTGWETFLEAVIRADLAVTGTWPIRTEKQGRSVANDTNALASSIVLVCRQRFNNAPKITRRDFINALKVELQKVLSYLKSGNIAPVDVAQAAIGPGMAVYSQYAKVIDAEGKFLSVRDALALINQTLDEILTEQEGDFDPDTRWAMAWFEYAGFAAGEYGVAETLSTAKNTSVSGMVEAGILLSKAGKVQLLRPKELSANWDPNLDKRLTVWEMVHHVIRVLGAGGESAAAKLVAKLGSKAETARELCYRLYYLCERKKRMQEALSYNSLIQSWPEISRLARESSIRSEQQVGLFE